VKKKRWQAHLREGKLAVQDRAPERSPALACRIGIAVAFLTTPDGTAHAAAASHCLSGVSASRKCGALVASFVYLSLITAIDQAGDRINALLEFKFFEINVHLQIGQSVFSTLFISSCGTNDYIFIKVYICNFLPTLISALKL